MKVKIKKNILIEIIAAFFILLYVYTALSKFYQYKQFSGVLSKSPLIGPISSYVAILIPSMELIISFMLFLPRFRKIGMYASTALMVLFTSYLIYMIYFTPTLPCSCGGVLSSLTWREHLVFNIAFTSLGILGILLFRNTQKNEGDLTPPSSYKYA